MSKYIIEIDDEDLTAFLGLPMDTPSLSAYHVREALKKGTECKQGEWIPKRLWDNTHIWVCSECGNPCKHGISIEKACWKCGADMRKGGA